MTPIGPTSQLATRRPVGAYAPRPGAQDPALAALVGRMKDGGMQASDVAALQRALVARGQSVGATGVDGKYGPATHAALGRYVAAQASASYAPTSYTPAPAANRSSWSLDLPVSQAPKAAPPPGGVNVAPGTPVASVAGLPAGAANTGKVAKETIAALTRAGGTSAVYTSAANGNREVAVWAPPGFDAAKPYTMLVYNHGIGGDNAKGLERDHLAKVVGDLNKAGGNVLLVLPKGPDPVHSWFSGSEDLGKVTTEAAARMGLGQPGRKVLMAHSGGGKSVMHALAKPNAPQFDQYMLADSTYGDWAGTALASLRAKQPGAQIATVVTDHNAARAQAQLGNQGLRVDRMPGSGPYTGHMGVPAYMVLHYLGPNADKGFSGV